MFVIFSLPFLVIETHQKLASGGSENLLFQTHTTRWFALSVLAANPLVALSLRRTDLCARVEPVLTSPMPPPKRMRQKTEFFSFFIMIYDRDWMEATVPFHCLNASQMSHSALCCTSNFCFALIHKTRMVSRGEKREL